MQTKFHQQAKDQIDRLDEVLELGGDHDEDGNFLAFDDDLLDETEHERDILLGLDERIGSGKTNIVDTQFLCGKLFIDEYVSMMTKLTK